MKSSKINWIVAEEILHPEYFEYLKKLFEELGGDEDRLIKQMESDRDLYIKNE